MHCLPAPRCLSLTRWISYQMMMQEESWIGFQSSYQTTFTLSCQHFLERSTSVYPNCKYETLLNAFPKLLSVQFGILAPYFASDVSNERLAHYVFSLTILRDDEISFMFYVKDAKKLIMKDEATSGYNDVLATVF